MLTTHNPPKLAQNQNFFLRVNGTSGHTGQAQPARAQTTRRPHIACTSIATVSMRSTAAIATTGSQCAPCAWLQNDETSSRAQGDSQRAIIAK